MILAGKEEVLDEGCITLQSPLRSTRCFAIFAE
jgi:hypothetical protein